MDERGFTCDIIVGIDCTDTNTFINSDGYTSEGWKDVLRNCPVSCNLCNSGTSRRHLEDDLSSDPCVCMPTWSMSKAGPNCTTQQGCPASACDDDPIGPWCEVANPGCATVESGESWAYCSPGTTTVGGTDRLPEDERTICAPFFRPMTRGQIPASEFLMFHELISHFTSFNEHAWEFYCVRMCSQYLSPINVK